MIANATDKAADQLNPQQNELASRLFIETMAELAKQRIYHGKLEDIADEFASALRVGLCELNPLGTLNDEPEIKPSNSVCPLGELRRRRKEELALIESLTFAPPREKTTRIKVIAVVLKRPAHSLLSGDDINPYLTKYLYRCETPASLQAALIEAQQIIGGYALATYQLVDGVVARSCPLTLSCGSHEEQR